MHVWIFRAGRIWAREAGDVGEDVGVVVVVVVVIDNVRADEEGKV